MPTARYGHDQRMLGLMLWPLIRNRCLVHDKYYRLPGVHTVPLRDPKINPRRLMLLARPEKEMSDAALAFGGLLAEAIEGLRD